MVSCYLIQYDIIQYNDIHIRYIIYMGAHLHVPSPLPLMAMQALVIQAGERLAQVMSELLTHRCRKWVTKSSKSFRELLVYSEEVLYKVN